MANDFRQQLRDAIEQSGLRRSEISKATGIRQSHLSGFVQGKEGLSIESISLICELLELRLVGRAEGERAERKAI